MDNYKKLMCVKGLIMSLDEQLYKLDQKELDKMQYGHAYNRIVSEYYKSIIEFLNRKDENNGEKT